MKIVQYSTEDEAQSIIAQKTSEGLTLVAVSNVTEGNFLGFMSNVPIVPPPLSAIVADQKQRLSDVELIMAELITGGF